MLAVLYKLFLNMNEKKESWPYSLKKVEVVIKHIIGN